MGTFHNGFQNIKVKLVAWEADNLAKRVYEFGRLSHDFNYTLTETYDEHHEDCKKLINKIVNGTTLPKFALSGVRFEFRIENISRICLAQITRDSAIFASASTGVFPMTQDFNIPRSVFKEPEIMNRLSKAQELLEEAYIIACEKEIPSIEARYIGLHCQTISLTASYTASDFVRSCYSRTSSNFCDECNYVYRLMYRELVTEISKLKDKNSKLLYRWMFPERKCINDDFYTRERIFNSDFTAKSYMYELPALNDWRKSGWKMELEEMYKNSTGYLTDLEKRFISDWMDCDEDELETTYDDTKPDVVKNMIKTMPYYRKVKYE